MTLPIEVRQAGAEDVAALALVGAATFLETFAGILDGSAIVEHCRLRHSETYYRDALAAGCWAYLAVAEPGDAPLGFALLGPADLPGATTSDIELKRIYVLSRFHGTGIGSRLMNAALAAATGHQRLLLGVFIGNRKAQDFYRHQGFEIAGKRSFRVGHRDYDDIVFAKAIGH